MSKKQGVCPHCGSYDNISLAGYVPLVRVALESADTGLNAVVYLDRGDDRRDCIPPPARFYCDNCNEYFDSPKFC